MRNTPSPMPTAIQIIKTLKKQGIKRNIEGMARYGINTQNALGVPMPVIRKTAKDIGKNHQLALELWDTGFHEAPILAALIAEPAKADEALMERWVADFDSWDVCDQVCGNFFDKTRFAYIKVYEWTKRHEEYVKRAGFVLMT